MDIFNFDPHVYLGFLLTFMRISIVVFMLPIFDVDGLPALWKASMCLILTFAIFPTNYLPGDAMPAHPFGILLFALGEVMIGFVLGFSTRLFFIGIQMGGEILAFQMGFTMISLSDPATGATTGVVAYFLNMCAMLIFLTFDGHLYLFKAFTLTFETLPAGYFAISENLFYQLVNLFSTAFVFGIKVAAPVMAALFLIEMVLALMTRTAPQMQIMQLGFTIKIAVGFYFLALLFVIMGQEASRFVFDIEPMFYNLIELMRGNN